jgi:uncharacterized protein
MSEDEELKRLISAIAAYARPKNILLFGSRARGRAQADSDFDLCVIYEKLPKRNLEVLQDLYRSIFPLGGHAVDLVVYESSRFDEKVNIRGTLEAAILAEGRVLYG